MDLSDDESIPTPPQPPPRVLPDRFERYLSVWRAVEDPNPANAWKYPKTKAFNSHLVFFPWLRKFIPAWPEGCKRIDYTHCKDQLVNVYYRVENKPSILAFICRDAIIVAAERASYTLIPFNSHVVGCIAGDADPDLFLRNLSPEGTALAISKKLAETHFSLNGNGLSEIVIAGWDKKGPSLYLVDNDGQLHQGILFARGYCAEYGYDFVGSKNFPFMSIPKAAELARIAIPLAIAESKFRNGSDGSGSGDSGSEDSDASESGKIGDSVEVYCVDGKGWRNADEEAIDTEEVDTTGEAGGSEPKRLKLDAVDL